MSGLVFINRLRKIEFLQYLVLYLQEITENFDLWMLVNECYLVNEHFYKGVNVQEKSGYYQMQKRGYCATESC